MDSVETNSESNILSSGGTDDAMNDADEVDMTEELSKPSLSTVRVSQGSTTRIRYLGGIGRL